MENKNSLVPVVETGGASGRGLATEPAPVDVPDKTWYIIEKGIMVNPTFTITIRARESIVVGNRDVEVEIDRSGVIIRAGDTELIIDPRYNLAELIKRGKLVAVADKVKYRWITKHEDKEVYEAKEFAELVARSVRELIEKAVNITAFS